MNVEIVSIEAAKIGSHVKTADGFTVMLLELPQRGSPSMHVCERNEAMFFFNGKRLCKGVYKKPNRYRAPARPI